MSDDAINLHDTSDAAVWADEFQRIVLDGGIEVDKGLMLGWFANAIMAGHDHALRKYSSIPMTEERRHAPFTFSYHRPDGGYTDDPSESHEPLPLEEAVFQALGYVSMCWSETPSGIFDSIAAKSAGDALVAYVRDMM